MKVLHTNAILDELAALSADAVTVIRNILTDENASPSLKLRAAKMVLDAAAAIEDGPDEPESAAAPVPSATGHQTPNPAVVEFPTAPAVRTNKLGRNEACSCGSGIKYKKCCLNKPRSAAPAPPPLARAA